MGAECKNGNNSGGQLAACNGGPTMAEAAAQQHAEEDPETTDTRERVPAFRGPARIALMLGALGVVYGDIGTSPVYAMQAVFAIDNGAVHPTSADVLGVVSLVVWSITLIVSIKYIT